MMISGGLGGSVIGPANPYCPNGTCLSWADDGTCIDCIPNTPPVTSQSGVIDITGGTGTASALQCCSGIQLGSGYANSDSGDIRYRISDGKDLCDPNCLTAPPAGTKTPTTSYIIPLMIVGGVLLIMGISR